MAERVELVPAARARQLIEHVLHPLVSDMERVRTGLWVRPVTGEIWAVIRLSSLKGTQYDVVYGLCCTWIPISAGRGKVDGWPRTMRQTTPHLWIDHFTLDAQPRQWISSDKGERVLREQAQSAVQQVLPRAIAWWATVSTVEGVLAEARRQARNTCDVHSPPAQLVVAFTLARLDRLPEAREALASADPAEASELHALLDGIPIPLDGA